MQLPKLSTHVLCCKLFTAPGFAGYSFLFIVLPHSIKQQMGKIIISDSCVLKDTNIIILCMKFVFGQAWTMCENKNKTRNSSQKNKNKSMLGCYVN